MEASSHTEEIMGCYVCGGGREKACAIWKAGVSKVIIIIYSPGLFQKSSGWLHASISPDSWSYWCQDDIENVVRMNAFCVADKKPLPLIQVFWARSGPKWLFPFHIGLDDHILLNLNSKASTTWPYCILICIHNVLLPILWPVTAKLDLLDFSL